MIRKIIAGMLILSLLALPLWGANVGEKRAVDNITGYLNKPLNTSVQPVKPDSASVRSLRAGSGQVHFGFSNTFPFNDLSITLQINREDSTYIFDDQIQDIDGAGGNGQYTTIVTLYGGGDIAETKFEYDVKTNTVEAVDARIMANLDVLVSTRLAPQTAGRTLLVGVAGHAAIDLGNKIGQYGANDFTDGFLTNAKIADGFLSSSKIAAGSITSTQAPNLDATISSRLAPGGTLATVTNVNQLGGTAAGLSGLNNMFNADENYAQAELTILGHTGLDYSRTIGAIGPEDLTDGLLTNGKFADGAITVTKIADGAITSAKAPNLDVAVSTRLAPTTAGRTLDVATTGEAGMDLSNVNGQLDAAEIATGAITSAKIAAGAITVTQAPNLDAAISSRLAPGGTLAQVTNLNQLGGSAVGITGLNEMFDADAVYAPGELTVTLASNGTENDTRMTTALNNLATLISATDSLETWTEFMMYISHACAGCSTKYLPADGTGYKDGYEVYQGGVKKATVLFHHNNNPAVLDARKTTKNY